MSYKLSIYQVKKIKRLRDQGWNYFQLGKEFNITFQHAAAICTGKRKVLEQDASFSQEKWHKVPSCPVLEASNLGRIRRLETKRTYAIRSTKSGYSTIGLSYQSKKYTKLVHRLVAEAFYGPCPKGYQVNHIDGNKINCCIENLEYLTPSQNNKHAYQVDLKSAKGEFNGRAKLTEQDVLQIRELAKQGKHYSDIASLFNVSSTHINSIINKVYWKHI